MSTIVSKNVQNASILSLALKRPSGVLTGSAKKAIMTRLQSFKKE